MDSKGLMPKQPVTAAPTRTAKDGFKGCTPLGEKRAGVMQIHPQSRDWQEMMVEKRLEYTPYLIDLLKSGRARLMFYEQATSTCQEKADVAGIDVQSVFKALVVEHFDPSNFESTFHLVVTDGTKKVDIPKLFGAMGEFEGKSPAYIRTNIRPSKTPPTGMTFGTVGPLIAKRNAHEIGSIIMKEPNGETGMEVDVSIGDVSLKGEQETMAHRFSVRIRYGDLVQTLSREYPDKVRMVGHIPAN